MRKTGTKSKQNTTVSSLLADQADIAGRIAAAVTGAVGKKTKLTGPSSSNGGATVNIHIGDIYLIGFDEAIDAEEWGMRETNTEIVGGASRSKNTTSPANEDALANKNRVIARKIDFSKGGVKLVATENSKPVGKKRQASRAAKPGASTRKNSPAKKRSTGKK